MSATDRYESSGGGTSIGYRVEARCTYSDAAKLGDQIITTKWTSLHFQQSLVGVPNNTFCPVKHGEELTYAAAQALMAWAEAASGRVFSGLQFRLVKLKTEWSHKTWTEGYGAERDFAEEERGATFIVRPHDLEEG